MACCQRPSQESGPQYSNKPQHSHKPVYRFAVHPLFNPKKLHHAYQPLMDYLNREIPSVSFELEASRDYADFNRKIREKGPDVLLPNPWQSLVGMASGYGVIAMAGEPSDFKGLLLVRRDASIQKPRDILGKTVAYPAPTALAACMMPQWFLHRQGIDPLQDLGCLYVGSQESAIMSVVIGQAQVGATWPPPWRLFQKEHPEEARTLRVAWETPSLVNNAVMVKNSFPIALKNRLLRCLETLEESPHGRDILKRMETERFLPASDQDYQVVRQFIDIFEKEVREVEKL